MFTVIFDEEKQYFQFVLKAQNGVSLLKSIAFPTKKAAKKAITLCREQVLLKTNFERKTFGNGKFHFIIKDKKRNILADSFVYSSEAGMQNGIEAISNYVPIADIDV